VVGVENIFTWYWIADLCRKASVDFVLGHALYMKAIHEVRQKMTRLTQEKSRHYFEEECFPAYEYPKTVRLTRDLLRRRNHFMRKRSELFAHIVNTASQYNLEEDIGKIRKKRHREGLVQIFHHPDV